jgi:hypothetical protein
MDARIWQKALDVIGAGNPFPMLYNDDVNVPGVARAFDVSLEQAGAVPAFWLRRVCARSLQPGTPNGTLNLLKALDVTLHDGVDSVRGQAAGLALGACPITQPSMRCGMLIPARWSTRRICWPMPSS